MVIYIKGFGILGLFSFGVNNIFSQGMTSMKSYSGLLNIFGSKIYTEDNFIGLCMDIFIKIIFSFNINNLSDFIRMFGIR